MFLLAKLFKNNYFTDGWCWCFWLLCHTLSQRQAQVVTWTQGWANYNLMVEGHWELTKHIFDHDSTSHMINMTTFYANMCRWIKKVKGQLHCDSILFCKTCWDRYSASLLRKCNLTGEQRGGNSILFCFCGYVFQCCWEPNNNNQIPKLF